ncbi:RING finger protein 24 [Exaiptasia diaphana]|uniref:RING-type E3 ubiquitin transferase n=1 Tax=Exaiptasia diaphana TaxID=2652724 RepID=A0A913YD84_EXADI|nr:RING finger protein 24 [Exaiptasia diaphana]XP_028512933.1 RING finger protein 24 [Exaiptasia diaphana]XP_028512934.1 RING finger protein 24 [Exaiptasia diaphana]KXJ18413.1 RING finger protein 122 [Exaiptasia diaphana]
MGDFQEILVFSLPVLLTFSVIFGLCCSLCCALLRNRRRQRNLLSQTARRPFPRGLKKVNFKNKFWFQKQKTNLKDDMCTICLEDFKGREEINMCKCGHAYHHKCIMKWLEIKDTCPICQRNVRRKSRTVNERTHLLVEALHV